MPLSSRGIGEHRHEAQCAKECSSNQERGSEQLTRKGDRGGDHDQDDNKGNAIHHSFQGDGGQRPHHAQLSSIADPISPHDLAEPGRQ